MKKIFCLFVASIGTAYGHHSLNEIITVSAHLAVSRCAITDSLPSCDGGLGAFRNIDIELSHCEHNLDTEICYGYHEINRERDGLPFNASINVKKMAHGQANPRYEITVGLQTFISSRRPTEVTIFPNFGSTLTDMWRIQSDMLWTKDNQAYYESTLYLGPAMTIPVAL